METSEATAIETKLAVFDTAEQTHFSRAQIIHAIADVPDDVWKEETTQYENLAFCMVEDTGSDCWGTYYGPYVKDRNKETGEWLFVPDKKEITPKTIAYWEKRASVVSNPMLKMRYTGLVLDFKEQVTGSKPDFKSIRKANIEAAISVAKDTNEDTAYDDLGYSLHAMEMAKRIKDKELTEQAASTYVSAYKCLSSDHTFIPFPKHFGGMLEQRDVFPDFFQWAVKNLEELFNEHEVLAAEEGVKTDRHSHDAKQIAELLSLYYKETMQSDLIKPLLDRTTNIIRKSFSLRGGMWAQGMMESMQKLYRIYHLYDDADSLYNDILSQADAAKSEMQHFSHNITISNHLWNKYWQSVTTGKDEDVICEFLFRNMPDVEKTKRDIRNGEVVPFMIDGFRLYTLDSNGVPISNIGTGKNPEEQKLNYSIFMQMKMTAAVLNEHINQLKNKGLLTVDKIMNEMFGDSPIIQEEQRPIVRRGLEAFLAEDYLVACHLLIPQIESAIRQICYFNGGEILRPKNNPDEGNSYKSLEGLLDQQCVNSALGDEFTRYLKVFLTDSNAGNYRNLTTHGLLKAGAFNSMMANRIFHAFLLLSLIKKETNSNSQSVEDTINCE